MLSSPLVHAGDAVHWDVRIHICKPCHAKQVTGDAHGFLSLQVNPKWGEKFDFVMASATSVLTVDIWDTLNWLEGRFSVKGLTGWRQGSGPSPCRFDA